MTPGFDTNGDDSSKDEEFASLIIPHPSESSFEKKCPRKSQQEKSLQSVEKHDGLKSNLKEVSGFTKQVVVVIVFHLLPLTQLPHKPIHPSV